MAQTILGKINVSEAHAVAAVPMSKLSKLSKLLSMNGTVMTMSHSLLRSGKIRLLQEGSIWTDQVSIQFHALTVYVTIRQRYFTIFKPEYPSIAIFALIKIADRRIWIAKYSVV